MISVGVTVFAMLVGILIAGEYYTAGESVILLTIIYITSFYHEKWENQYKAKAS
jgi:hypothetical protein